MGPKLLIFSLFLVALAIVIKIFILDLSFINAAMKILYNDTQNYGKEKNNLQLFTKDELKRFNGQNKGSIYISILGTVYDVTRAEKHYGPGQTYNVFAGRDASKSFITGNFNEDNASDDVTDLSPEDLMSLKQWKQFYEKEYVVKGKLIGRYYDESGKPTRYSELVEELIAKAEKEKHKKDSDEKLYPPCNVEWDAEQGTRVWCTTNSGGIARDWSGYPRKYYAPGSQDQRCACVMDFNGNDSKIKLYENCDSKARSCHIIT